MDQAAPEALIRITRQEAMGDHAADLLQRQKNMRGEGGVGRVRHWYYQGWLLLALVGGLGALAAYAILEPVYDDFQIRAGAVEKVSYYEESVAFLDRVTEAEIPVVGQLQIGPDTVYLPYHLRDAHTGETIDPYGLADEQVVALHVEWMIGMEGQEQVLRPLALWLDADPSKEVLERGGADLEQSSRLNMAVSFSFFGVIAGMVGLFLGAVDGLICRLLRRALLCGVVGMLVGLVGGFSSGLFANILYSPVSEMAQRTEGTLGIALQMGGRTLAWGIAGMAMGLGQGIALRSRKLLTYGLLGGVIGGLMGGMVFDPINLLSSSATPSAHLSRLLGVLSIGVFVGLMIGLVEILARDAWLKMLQGPLAGKEFLVFKDVMHVGSSPRSDVYLFNDPDVRATHALMRSSGDFCEIEALSESHPVLVNGAPVQRRRLRAGDRITIGNTIFAFQERRKQTA